MGADVRPLRVLYNATSAKVGGGLTYALNQVAALADQPGMVLTVLTAPANHEAFAAHRLAGSVDRLEKVQLPKAALRFAWEQVALPWRARGFDLLVNPANFGSVVSPVPQVVILQNPNYVGHGRRLPQNASPRRRAKIAASMATMRRAHLLVSVSESLSDDIGGERWLRTVPLATVRSGAAAAPADAGPEARAATTAAVTELVGHEPYLLSVANDYPHKRLEDLGRLVVALGDRPELVQRVVLVGDIADHRRSAIRAAAGNRADRLVFLGTVTDRAVVLELFTRAAAAVSTSELESWGLTLHEAASVGCPLVVTDLGVHREICGDVANYFAPGDVAAMVRTVEAATTAPRPEPWFFEWTWADHGEALAAELRRLHRRKN